MNDRYPPGVFELPGERDESKTYIFEVGGEVEVEAYSEEDAENELKINLGEILADAVRDGTIQIQ